jgi:N-acetylmuramoyl-L-alanine amidase
LFRTEESVVICSTASAQIPGHSSAVWVLTFIGNMRWNNYLSGLFTFGSSGLLVLGATLSLSLPAMATKLQSWRFDVNRNQLEFSTDGNVQPRAQLVLNPTRLVIDLEGVTFGRPQTSQPVNKPGMRSVRVGQFEKGITRIVIELEPGYTIDPNQVQFRGTTPRQWAVTIPQPQLGGPVAPDPSGANPPPQNIPTNLPEPTPIVSSPAASQIQNVRATGDGIFIRTSGAPPQLRVNRSRDRRLIDVDLLGTSLSPSVSPRDFVANQKGVGRVIITQPSSTPPIARITLSVDPDSPDWQASLGSGGVVLLPSTGTSPSPNLPPIDRNKVTSIQTVELDQPEQQLLIAADQPIDYSAGWDRSAGLYKITLNNAQLNKNIRGPQLTPNSPLLQVRLRQETPKTVTILVAPASGVQIGNPITTSRQTIVFPLSRSGRPPVIFPTNGSIRPPISTTPGGGLTRPPIGRGAVIIDPGHGGPDPGAVGIGNIYEKDIVLDISRQVAAILAQNGIQVALTRDNDIDLDLQPRVDMAERANAALFVSIHANSISMARPDVNGLETYYYDSGLGLARSIHANVLQSANIADRGVRQARFFVLRKTSMPSVLVETGFVTGATDAANLANPTHRRQMAEGIARGIMQYMRGS